jgi:hypothetical protein
VGTEHLGFLEETLDEELEDIMREIILERAAN